MALSPIFHHLTIFLFQITVFFYSQSIKKAASVGMQSTSLTNQIETFLSITPIPGIQGADKVITGMFHPFLHSY
jgi:hypothetical protein